MAFAFCVADEVRNPYRQNQNVSVDPIHSIFGVIAVDYRFNPKFKCFHLSLVPLLGGLLFLFSPTRAVEYEDIAHLVKSIGYTNSVGCG